MSVLIILSALLDEAKCFELVRQTRWPQGVRCPKCGGEHVVRNGRDDTQPHRQRYLCNDCQFRFDDLSDTALAGHHQPLRVWILCLYFMGLNLSNRQIAQELSLNENDVQEMRCKRWRARDDDATARRADRQNSAGRLVGRGRDRRGLYRRRSQDPMGRWIATSALAE